MRRIVKYVRIKKKRCRLGENSISKSAQSIWKCIGQVSIMCDFWICVLFELCSETKASSTSVTNTRAHSKRHPHKGKIILNFVCARTPTMCVYTFFTYIPLIFVTRVTFGSLSIRFSFFPNGRSAIRFSVQWLWTSFALIYDWVVAFVIEVRNFLSRKYKLKTKIYFTKN